VIHGIGVPAVDADESAVAAHHLLPARNTVELLGAVVLAAAVGDVRIGRMQRDPRKLRDLQIVVEIRPLKFGGVRIIQAPDAAVIPVQEFTIGVEVKSVNVGMSAAGNYRPGVAAIGAFHHARAAPIGGAADVNDIGIGWIHGHGNVVVSLAGLAGKEILPPQDLGHPKSQVCPR
jgi:hypothetical protein